MTTPTWQRVDVTGRVRLVAGRTGSGNNPIVALHGLSGDHRYFDGVAAGLNHPDGVLALDLRGRGESAKPLTGYGLHAHARDIVRMLDQQGIERVTLVGHSMGGYVALEVALRYPERVSGVVLIDSGWPRPLVPLLASNAWALFSGIAKVMLRMARLSPLEYNAVQQDSWWVAATAPTTRELRALSCPVTLIRAGHGFTSRSAPIIDESTLSEIKAAMPLAGDVRLDGANHYTMLQDPRFARRVAAEIDRFQKLVAARDRGLG